MYEANKKLESILLNHGFIETTSERNKLKGKKRFKLSKSARKSIYFDYINICIVGSPVVHDSKITLTEMDLKSVLLYFKLKPSDYKEIDWKGSFKFGNTEIGLDRIKQNVDLDIRLNVKSKKRDKLMRILKIYEDFNI